MLKMLRSGLIAAFLGATVLVGASSPASARGTVMEVLNTRPVAGEMTTFLGRASTNFANRKVVLQYWKKSKWVTKSKLKTKKNGWYEKDLYVTSPTSFRLYGAKTKYKGKKYKAIKSGTFKVIPVGQTVSKLYVPSSTPREDEITTFDVTITPVRQYRPVYLQENYGSGWVTVGSTVQNHAGKATITRKSARRGTFQMRAVSGWSGGAQASNSQPISVTVRPPLLEKIESDLGEVEMELQHDISSDGRWVSFVGVNHGTYYGERFNRAQVYLRDRTTHTTTLISRTAGGAPDLARPSSLSAVSANGKYVTYTRTTFIPATPTQLGREMSQVVWYDVTNKLTKVVFETGPIISSTLRQVASPDISDDGKTVAFTAQSIEGDQQAQHPAVWNADSNETTVLNQSGGSTRISGDGHYVTFAAPGSKTDLFRWDGTSPTAELVSSTPTGEPGDGSSSRASLSEDGRWIAFTSRSTNLTSTGLSAALRFYLRDMTTGTTTLISSTPSASDQIEISGDAATIAYVQQTGADATPSVIVADRATLDARTVFEGEPKETNRTGYLRLTKHGEFLALSDRTPTLSTYAWDNWGEVLVRDLSE